MLLAAVILFGLLSALLEGSNWYFLSWMAMSTPLIIIIWKIWGRRIIKY